MDYLRILLLLVFLGACSSAGNGSLQVAADYAITHANVIDVETGRVLSEQTVLIEGNRIVAVGPAGVLALPMDVEAIDARGKYVIPGLWDMHAHVLFEGMDGYLKLLVANGVTGIREMGNSPIPLEEIRRIRGEIGDGDLVGPRFIASGVLVDGPESKWTDGVVLADSPERGRAIVDSLAGAGADFVKVYNYLRPEVYRAILAAAAARQIPVAGHVPFLVTALEASESNQHSFEHLIGVDQACSTQEESLIAISRKQLDAMARSDTAAEAELERQWWDLLIATHHPARCRRVLERLARNRTWQTPTLVNIQKKCVDPATLRSDDRLSYVPAYIRGWWNDAAPATGDVSPEDQARCRVRMSLVGEMEGAGVPLLAGSDAANPFVIWGFSLHEELVLMVEAGLSPLQALQAATLNPARFMEATDSVGKVQNGLLADLVLLDGNPLDDIRNTRKIAAVVLSGRYMDRRELDRLLAEIALAADK